MTAGGQVYEFGAGGSGDAREPANSPLEALRARVKAEGEDETVVLPVPGDKTWSVRFSKKIDYDDLERLNRAATEKRTVNLGRFSGLLLVEFCRGILYNGEDYILNGEPVTFGSDAFRESTGAIDDITAVKRFYDGDGPVIATATGLIGAAGYGDEVLPDPTKS